MGHDPSMEPLPVELEFGGTSIDATWRIPLQEFPATLKRASFDSGGLALEFAAPVSPFWLERLQADDDALLREAGEHPLSTFLPIASILADLPRPEERPTALLPSDPEERVGVAAARFGFPVSGVEVLAAFAQADESTADGPPVPGAGEDLLALLRADSGEKPGFLSDLADVLARLVTRLLGACPARLRAAGRITFAPQGLELVVPAASARGSSITLAGFRQGSELHNRRLAAALRTVRAAHSALEQAGDGTAGTVAALARRWVGLMESRFGGRVVVEPGRCLLHSPSGVAALCCFRVYRGAGREWPVLELRLPLAASGGGASTFLSHRTDRVHPFAFRTEDDTLVLALDHALSGEDALERAWPLVEEGLALAPLVLDWLEAEPKVRHRPIDPQLPARWLGRHVSPLVDVVRQKEDWRYEREKLLAQRAHREQRSEKALARALAVDVAWVRDALVLDYARHMIGIDRVPKAMDLWQHLTARAAVDALFVQLLDSRAASDSIGRRDLVGLWLASLSERPGTASTLRVLPRLEQACGPGSALECYPEVGALQVRCDWFAWLLNADRELLAHGLWGERLAAVMKDASVTALADDLEPAVRLYEALRASGDDALAETWANTVEPVLPHTGAPDFYRRRLDLEEEAKDGPGDGPVSDDSAAPSPG